MRIHEFPPRPTPAQDDPWRNWKQAGWLVRILSGLVLASVFTVFAALVYAAALMAIRVSHG